MALSAHALNLCDHDIRHPTGTGYLRDVREITSHTQLAILATEGTYLPPSCIRRTILLRLGSPKDLPRTVDLELRGNTLWVETPTRRQITSTKAITRHPHPPF